ncbi:MAG: response regulator, partial [Succinivibrio sp.]|nr:response regulator [Succinivibrio sp.]
EGSEFRLKIYLPRENPDQEEMENYSRVIGYKTEDKKKIRILTVDDNEDHRVIIRTLLSPLGFEIGEANGFDSAMKLIGKENFDLFFVDYSMPGHNGLYLAKNLRKKGINSPIIMVSANASELKINVSRDRRIYDYHIVKPFRKEQLLDAIVHFLPIDYICQDKIKKDESTSDTDRITALELTDKKDSRIEKAKTENKNSLLSDAKSLTEQLRIYLETGFVKGILNNLDTQHNLGLLSDELFLKYKNKAERFDFEYIRKDIQNS